MGLLNDIKQEWTWRGIKKSFRDSWPDLLAVFIAGFTTPIVVKRMGWQDSTLAFFFVNVLLVILAGVIMGVAGGIKRKIKG